MNEHDLIKNKIAAKPTMFAVKHYAGEKIVKTLIFESIRMSQFLFFWVAGDVVYTADGFIEKNRDTLTHDLLEMMEKSQNALAKLLFQDDRKSDEKAKRNPTISMQFRRQVMPFLVDSLLYSLLVAMSSNILMSPISIPMKGE